MTTCSDGRSAGRQIWEKRVEAQMESEDSPDTKQCSRPKTDAELE